MLKHAGMLEPQPIPNLDLSSDNTKAQYGAWIRRESRNRYCNTHEFGITNRESARQHY